MSNEKSGLKIAIVGLTGAVGRELVSLLGERRVNVSKIMGYASDNSVGEGVDFLDEEVIAKGLADIDFSDCDVVLFACPAQVTRVLFSRAIDSGAIAIDVMGHLAEDGVYPLILPEVNAAMIDETMQKTTLKGGVGFICPSSASVALAVTLAPLCEHVPLKRVVVAEYQSASRFGRGGIDELWKQTLALFNSQEMEINRFPRQMAFNCFPHIGEFDEQGNSNEEKRIVSETRDLLGLDDLPISVTAVQVPVFNCCALAVNVQFMDAFDPQQAREILSNSFGVIVQDDPEQAIYPDSFELGGSDAVYVGRIRGGFSEENVLDYWVIVDNLRKGSALNAIQIMERTMENENRRRSCH